MTGNDADAVSFSEPGRSGQRMDRADGSANMWANANAAAQAYKAAGDTANAEKMQAIADKIQKEVTTELWDKSDNLLKHKWLNDGAFAKYKEINNYYPYSEGLMPTGNEDYNKALRLFEDSNEFPIFPFFTANQADKAALNFPVPTTSPLSTHSRCCRSIQPASAITMQPRMATSPMSSSRSCCTGWRSRTTRAAITTTLIRTSSGTRTTTTSAM